MPPKPKIAAKNNTDTKTDIKVNNSLYQDNIIENDEQDRPLNTGVRPPERRRGGFFSFFSRIFGIGRTAEPNPHPEEDLIRNEEDEVNGGNDIIEENGNDVNNINEREENNNEITQAAVGGISGPWRAQNDAASYLTDLPSKGSFLRDFERPYNEPVNRAPVFESSAFFRGIGMHSYMGLRYSRLDPETGFIMRKRIGVGFGSGSGPANYGKINNESWNLTDGSSETPITIEGLNNTIRAIEATNSNIQAAKDTNPIWRFFTKAQVNPEGFSGKYNLLTYNCNDFVIFMAKKAGAVLPSQFHDSILGPMVAYKNLRLAAERGEMSNGTRIFFANALQGKVSDTSTKKGQLLFDFYAKAKFGAEKDGINLSKYPEFDALLKAISNDAYTTIFNACFAREGNGGIPDANRVPNNLEQAIAMINTRIRQAVVFNTGKRHPKITRYLLQLEAIGRELITNSPPGEKTIADYTDYEVNYATSKLSEEEAAAKNSGATSISDTVLFSDNNSYSDNLRPIGNLLLIALGKGNLVKTTNRGLGTVRATNRTLLEIREITKKENAQNIFRYVEKFVENRTFLTTEQIGKLLLNGILFATGHGRLASQYQSTWKLDPSAPDYEQRRTRLRDIYLKAKESGKTDPEMRQNNLDLIDAILQNMKDIVTQVRGENQEQQANPEEDQKIS